MSNYDPNTKKYTLTKEQKKWLQWVLDNYGDKLTTDEWESVSTTLGLDYYLPSEVQLLNGLKGRYFKK